MPTLPRCLLLLLALVWTTPAMAQQCCPYCGCQEHIQRVCRVTCEMKKVPKTTYSCECEDFCVPDRSKFCGYTCEVDCDGCKTYKQNRIPQGSKIFCRKKLVKTTVDKEEPVYIWKVEYLCQRCAAEAAQETAQLLSERKAASGIQQVGTEVAAKPKSSPSARTKSTPKSLPKEPE